MKADFKQYILSNLNCLPFSAQSDNLALFCHYDQDNLIADYVVKYLKNLKNSNCDVVFISNSNPDKNQLDKIKNIVNQIIIRKNIGYDFGAYFTGFLEHQPNLKNYKNLLLINDSVFAPFYSLQEVFGKMNSKNLDMWGITDAFHKNYHIQSYFWSFKTSDKVLQILETEAENYDFNLPKSEIVGKYEEGLTAKMMKAELNLGVLCSNAEAINFEMTQTQDEELKELKTDMIKIAKSKRNIIKKLKSLISVKENRFQNFIIPDANAYLTGINSCWYSQIKYFECPFIKVSLLKSAANFRYHGFRYIEVIKQKYPDYDWNLIEKHLNRLKSKN